MAKHFLITGGLGFIGSHMAETLLGDESNRVTILDNLSSGKVEHVSHLDSERLTVKEGDVRHSHAVAEALKGVHFVFHFAANPDIARGVEDPSLDFEHTIVATFTLLEAMRQTNVKDIAYASGSGVYGDRGHALLSEDFGPLLPASMYGASKLSAEGLISAFAQMFGLRGWMFRFANVVGRRQTHGVGFDFIRKLQAQPQELEILGDGQQSKSYIHVSDVIDAMLLVTSKWDDPVSLVNVSTDDYLSVDEIADIVIQEMDLQAVTRRYTGGQRGWVGDVPVVRLATEKIRKLDWSPRMNSAAAVRHSVREMLGKA